MDAFSWSARARAAVLLTLIACDGASPERASSAATETPIEPLGEPTISASSSGPAPVAEPSASAEAPPPRSPRCEGGCPSFDEAVGGDEEWQPRASACGGYRRLSWPGAISSRTTYYDARGELVAEVAGTDLLDEHVEGEVPGCEPWVPLALPPPVVPERPERSALVALLQHVHMGLDVCGLGDDDVVLVDVLLGSDGRVMRATARPNDDAPDRSTQVCVVRELERQAVRPFRAPRHRARLRVTHAWPTGEDVIESPADGAR